MFHDPVATYLVVVNGEEQYSIWPQSQPLPIGWNDQGFKGNRADCLAEIAKIWTDMRPKSLRDLTIDASTEKKVKLI